MLVFRIQHIETFLFFIRTTLFYLMIRRLKTLKSGNNDVESGRWQLTSAELRYGEKHAGRALLFIYYFLCKICFLR
ncbi:MAG TPA: hypothetical protein DD640_06395 [Clostridiales bacterium]|nr:hypothetical protein [Clostridiales bacterium]